jgi:hypothetical protein
VLCGVRSVEGVGKTAWHLARFRAHFADAHGHERLSAVVRREVVASRDYLASSPESTDVQGTHPPSRPEPDQDQPMAPSALSLAAPHIRPNFGGYYGDPYNAYAGMQAGGTITGCGGRRR